MNRAELYYDQACRRMEEQWQRNRQLKTTAAAILALSGALIGIMTFTVSEWIDWSWIPAVVVIIAFFAVALFVIGVLGPRKWQYQPPLDKLYEQMEALKDEEVLTIWAAESMRTAIKANDKWLDEKADWLKDAAISLAFQVTALALVAISVAV